MYASSLVSASGGCRDQGLSIYHGGVLGTLNNCSWKIGPFFCKAVMRRGITLDELHYLLLIIRGVQVGHDYWLQNRFVGNVLADKLISCLLVSYLSEHRIMMP